MRLQDQVYEVYRNNIDENMDENRRGALAMKEALERSPLNHNGVMEKTLQIPKVFDAETVERFREITAISIGIFDKVVSEYRKNPEYRKLFPFSKELEELILLPASYDGNLAIARLDLFYDQNSGDFRFCEINTDGTAAMYRDLEMRKALIFNPAHRAVEEKFELEPFELFDSWVRTFLSLYDTYGKKRENPLVVMPDFLENATIKEFEEFERSFKKAGVQCETCDIRSLKYTDGVLYTAEGKRIDAIYRRAVTADIMAHYDEVGDFVRAVRDDAVFVAGAFATQIIHNKWIFHVLRRDKHLLHTGTVCRKKLLRQTAYGCDRSAKRNFPRHGPIGREGYAAHQRGDGSRHGYTGRRSVFGDCAFRYMDVQVIILKEFRLFWKQALHQTHSYHR